MKIRQILWLLSGIALSASLACASNITYLCSSTVTANTCTYLNTTVSAIYNNTFINAVATIYVNVGSTDDIAESSYEWNGLSYTSYVADLTSKSTIDSSDGALAALSSYDTSVYGGSVIGVTAALGQALGVSTSSLFGVNNADAVCQGLTTNPANFGLSTTCYAGYITLNSNNYPNSTTTDYNASNPGAYNIATEVEHETDEILGTGSCIGPNGGSECGSTATPSAVDLFRFSGAGNLVTESEITSTAGAYFSFDGGLRNGANGANYAAAIGFDYADFSSSCSFVQDASGCQNANLNINTDGPHGGNGPEVTILNVLGYNLQAGVTDGANTVTTPEPGTLSLLAIALGAVVMKRRRRV